MYSAIYMRLISPNMEKQSIFGWMILLSKFAASWERQYEYMNYNYTYTLNDASISSLSTDMVNSRNWAHLQQYAILSEKDQSIVNSFSDHMQLPRPSDYTSSFPPSTTGIQLYWRNLYTKLRFAFTPEQRKHLSWLARRGIMAQSDPASLKTKVDVQLKSGIPAIAICSTRTNTTVHSCNCHERDAMSERINLTTGQSLAHVNVQGELNA